MIVGSKESLIHCSDNMQDIDMQKPWVHCYRHYHKVQAIYVC
ncbi:hypothetical protein A359_02070 [secondary endosymbiont of Ctenarytaina eucalypti]|uniref:Uncharacterized protein n=1 Tax=secondary endosymbiont of Ctenarytaina eucalypti TaxID=1199245 RepID=J3YRD7_9ENTR|nr:hypothetical protein A359_02070 [secondary endosymbiont of Ctenarytaina eucalypti]